MSDTSDLVIAARQIADNLDLRDKPKHPLNRIADLLESIDATLSKNQYRLDDIACELTNIKDTMRNKG